MKSWLNWLLVGLVLISPVALAAATNRDPATEEKIIAPLRARAPELVPIFVAATEAFDAGKMPDAESLFRAVVAKDDRFDPALRRLGSAIAQQGRQQEGVAWVERAVAIDRSVANLISLAHVVAFPASGEASQADLQRALALTKECHGKPGDNDINIWSTQAQLYFNLQNPDGARDTVREMQRRFPDEMVTHYFAAVINAMDEHWIAAAKEIRLAGKLGLPQETVQRFLDSGVGMRATAWRGVQITGWSVVVWIVGLSTLFGLGFVLSRVTLRQIERSDPAVPVTTGERRLRRIYRSVLNIAGVYYYISLPVVAVLVVVIAAAVIYGFLMVGRIPIQITIMLVIGTIATVWAMGKSLLLKVKTEDPGRALTREEAPGMWKLVEDVAQRLQTKPINEIRVTVGTDLCVYERGTWRQKMKGEAPRILVIGVAVLDGFKKEDFRSVLAHEYGHFANRDTAGGDIAMRVQNDMMKFAHAMIAADQASWFNAAFQFLRFYHFIFRRISHGATRLQEVLADRVAAQAFGAKAFEGGLTHVIRESFLFDARAEFEVNEIMKNQRPVRNLYDRSVEVPSVTVEKNVKEALNRATTEDDTHPSPRDRFRLTQRVPAASAQSLPGEVWDLFANKDALISEMMENVQKNVSSNYR